MTTIAPTTPSTPSTAGSATNSTGTLSFTQNFNTFLTLLTTQLQNQDPLSPMDTNQFTQQLVSFSQVEQQIDTNNYLQQLIQLQTAGQTMAALPMIGQTIEYNGASAPLQNGQASFVYTLPKNAAQAALVVADSTGRIVYSTAADTAVGPHSFVWNGQTMTGQQMPDGGAYTLKVIATGSDSNAIDATVQSIGTVSSVSVDNGSATFNLDGIAVPMSQLVTVISSRDASASN
jgi:flagellar basal-body rod modification protein FlgD